MNDNIQGGKVSEGTKMYLKQAYKSKQLIDDNLMKLAELRTMASSVGAVDTSKDKVQSGKVSDIIGDAVPAIVDLETEINGRIETYKVVLLDIESNIAKVTDERFTFILLKRYIFFKSWEQIAVDLNYSYVHTIRLHGEALQAFDAVFRNRVIECYQESVV